MEIEDDEPYTYESAAIPEPVLNALELIDRVISDTEFLEFEEKLGELVQQPLKSMMLFAVESFKAYHYLQAHLATNDLDLNPDAKTAILAVAAINYELWGTIELSLAPKTRH